MRITMLGSGGSGGVPLSNGEWGGADPAEPKNRRRRVSVLVETGGKTILIDTSPDLRAQLLDAGVERIDAVLFTHHHADHCHGLDDLRALSYKAGPIPAYMDRRTYDFLSVRFDYAFVSSHKHAEFYPAIMEDRLIEAGRSFEPCEGISVRPFKQSHGPRETSLGFRIGDFAYSTDVVELDDAAFEALAGVRLWIVDSLRAEPHPTHAHHERTFQWIDRVRPERAILTHMNHTIDYNALNAICPQGVEPGYDGLEAVLDD